MGRRAIAVMAVLILVVNLFVSFVVPSIAESVIAGRLAEEFSDQLGTDVEIELDVASLASLLQGRIASIVLSADSLVAETAEGEAVELTEIAGTLRHVQVDVGGAIGGRLATVEVLDSDLRASLGLGFVEGLLRDGIDEGGSFTFVSMDVDGSSFVITLAAPDGSQQVEAVRPAVLAGEVRLVPTVRSAPDDDPVTTGVRDALGDVRISLPVLPLGIELREVVAVRSDHLVLGGRLPQTVTLS